MSRDDDHTPELKIQRKLVKFLRERGWHVEYMLANGFQCGIPDLYCFHKKYGPRWVEVKRPEGYSFTDRQRRKFPEWERAGIGIWILTAATDDQYKFLFGPPNWRMFWKPSHELPNVDAMIAELVEEEKRMKASEAEGKGPQYKLVPVSALPADGQVAATPTAHGNGNGKGADATSSETRQSENQDG
jgi:hypothetical protein